MKPKVIKHILSYILIGILFIPSLSSFIAEDSNLDRKIDLKDAITNLQAHDRISKKSHAEHSNKTLQTSVNTLKTIAGLKEIFIPQEDDENSLSAQSYPLIASFEFNSIPIFYENILETTLLYNSILITPPSPPPLNA